MSYLYNNMVDACGKGAKNWASNVKTLLDTYVFSYAWCNPGLMNLKTFTCCSKKELLMYLNSPGLMI